MKSKNIVIFGVLIVAVIGGMFLFNSFLKKNIASDDGKTSDEVVVEELKPFLSVPKQASDIVVFVERAVLPQEGFVAIYKEKDGKPSSLIGSSVLLKKGVNSNFQVNVSPKTVVGETLYAILHLDNDDGVFELEADMPVVSKTGDVIFSKFVIVDTSEFENAEKL